MIFGLFKDKETIQLSKDLAVTFLEVKRALMGIPKNKLSEKNIFSAFSSLKPYPLVSLPFVHSVVIEKLEISINIKNRDLHLSVRPKFTGSGTDYKNYELTLTGIYDYNGFSISYKPDETKPTVLLLDTSKQEVGPHVIPDPIIPTKKSKILYEEFSRMTKFFNTQKI